MKIICSICQDKDCDQQWLPKGADPLTEGRIIRVLSCGHLYHKYCLKKHHRQQEKQRAEKTCPECRSGSKQHVDCPHGVFFVTAQSSSTQAKSPARPGKRRRVEVLDSEPPIADSDPDQQIPAPQPTFDEQLDAVRRERDSFEEENCDLHTHMADIEAEVEAAQEATTRANLRTAELETQLERTQNELSKARDSRNRTSLLIAAHEKAEKDALKAQKIAEMKLEQVKAEAAASVSEAASESANARKERDEWKDKAEKAERRAEQAVSFERLMNKWKAAYEKQLAKVKVLQEKSDAALDGKAHDTAQSMPLPHRRKKGRVSDETQHESHFDAAPPNGRMSPPKQAFFPKFNDISQKRATVVPSTSNIYVVDDDDLDDAIQSVSDDAEESFMAQDAARFKMPTKQPLRENASAGNVYRMPPPSKQALGPKYKVRR